MTDFGGFWICLYSTYLLFNSTKNGSLPIFSRSNTNSTGLQSDQGDQSSQLFPLIVTVCFVANCVIPRRILSIQEDGAQHMSVGRVKELEVSH